MVKVKTKKSGKKWQAAPWLFLLPFILVYAGTFLYPAFYSLYLSFFKYKGYGEAKFIGISNYKNLLTYRTMWVCLGNTLFYFIASYIPTMLISFLLAVMVRSKTLKRFQRIYKPIIFLPQICAVVASSLLFQIIFGGQVGVINQLLGTQIPFLSDLHYMKWPVVVLITWRGVGWYFVIFLAGLTNISEEVEEAALVDGANAFQNLTNIIIPLMKPSFMLTSITYAIGSLKLYSEPNVLLGGKSEAPLQVAPYVNIVTTNVNSGNFGMAAAAGWLLVLLILVCTLLQMKVFGGED